MSHDRSGIDERDRARDLVGVHALRSLYEHSTAGAVKTALTGVKVGWVMVERENVLLLSPGAVAWRVGLDPTTTEFEARVTHLLLPAGAPG